MTTLIPNTGLTSGDLAAADRVLAPEYGDYAQWKADVERCDKLDLIFWDRDTDGQYPSVTQRYLDLYDELELRRIKARYKLHGETLARFVALYHDREQWVGRDAPVIKEQLDTLVLMGLAFIRSPKHLEDSWLYSINDNI